MESDDALLAAWRAGDGAAGQRLCKRHWEAVYGFFRTKLADGALDLAQETFERCVRQAERPLAIESFRPFLFGIARHVLVDRLRAMQAGQDRIDTGVTSLDDLRPSPSSLAAEREERRVVCEALARLPIDHQIAIELRFWHELTFPEIASVLEVPEGTVKSRVRLGLEQLRQHLARAEEGAIERWLEDTRE